MKQFSVYPESIKHQFSIVSNEKMRDFTRPFRFFVIDNPYVDCRTSDNGVCVVYFDIDDKRLYYRLMTRYDAMSFGFIPSLFMQLFLNPKSYFDYLRDFFIEGDFSELYANSCSLTETNNNVDSDFKDNYLCSSGLLLSLLDLFKREATSSSDLATDVMLSYFKMRDVVFDILKYSGVF